MGISIAKQDAELNGNHRHWPVTIPIANMSTVSELQEGLARIDRRLRALRQRRREATKAHQYSEEREIEEDINMLCRVRVQITKQLAQQEISASNSGSPPLFAQL